MKLEMLVKKLSQEYLRDHYDALLRSTALLLAAHGAGFAACLLALKDYDTIPRLKGIGLIVTLEGLGLIAGAIFYLVVHFSRSGALLGAEIDSDGVEGAVLLGITILAGAVSFVTFIATIGIVTYKFYSL